MKFMCDEQNYSNVASRDHDPSQLNDPVGSSHRIIMGGPTPFWTKDHNGFRGVSSDPLKGPAMAWATLV